MKLNRKNAYRIWEKQFCNADFAYDIAGRLIKRLDYGKRTSPYGWNLDHIKPKSKGGKSNIANLTCMHIKTNTEKRDNFPEFSANEKDFEIQEFNGAFIIVQVKNEHAKRCNAMRLWALIHGKNTQSAKDFCGRTILKKDFANLNFSTCWGVDTYNGNEKDIFIANVKTIQERKARPCFKSNGFIWQMRRVKGSKEYIFQKREIKHIIED